MLRAAALKKTWTIIHILDYRHVGYRDKNEQNYKKCLANIVAYLSKN